MSEEDPETRRKVVWPPVRPRREPIPTPVQALPEFQPLAARSTCGLLNSGLLQVWEATVTGPELDKWRKIEALLDGTSSEFQIALLCKIMRRSVELAKSRRNTANTEGENFKRDLIDRNLLTYEGQSERVDAALFRVLRLLADTADQSANLQAAWQSLEDTLITFLAQGQQLQQVSEPWLNCQPGAERGRGMTGYDTPANVERVRKELEAKRAAKLKEKDKPKAAEPPKIEAPAPKPPAPKDGLFGH